MVGHFSSACNILHHRIGNEASLLPLVIGSVYGNLVSPAVRSPEIFTLSLTVV